MLNQDNMPGAGSIGDTLEFMRKMWGSLGAPAMGIPSLSVEEINKKIADLKTVASWLELNMNMLRATIQTMEVQSATLSTLQAMGAILTPQPAAPGAASATAAAEEEPPRSSFANWPQPPGKADHTAAQQEEEEEPAPDAAEEDEPAAEPEQVAAAKAAQAAASAAPVFQAAMSNPNAWWNLLQEQFQQAVGNVLAEQQPVPVKKAAATPGKTAKTATKSRAKTASAAKPAPKKTTKPKTAAKPDTRAKSTVVQSRQSKSGSRKPSSL